MKHIVMDLEMNPIGREHKDIRHFIQEEIIEIGAVSLDESYQVKDTFQCYVRPQFGQVTRHITRLTGITAEMLADKDDFAICFSRFWSWAGHDESRIYSWSESDLKQLAKEYHWKMPKEQEINFAAQWVDLQKEFDDRIGLHNNLGLRHALGAIDHKFEGVQHTALADDMNTAAILELMQDEQAFQLKLKPVLELLQPQEFASSIGDLCPELVSMQSKDDV